MAVEVGYYISLVGSDGTVEPRGSYSGATPEEALEAAASYRDLAYVYKDGATFLVQQGRQSQRGGHWETDSFGTHKLLRLEQPDPGLRAVPVTL